MDIEVEAKLNVVIVWSLAKTYLSNLIVISVLLKNPRIRHPITDINGSISSKNRVEILLLAVGILITLVSRSRPF